MQLPGASTGDIESVEGDRAAVRLAKPGDGAHQLVLAVPGDAGDAQDLAGVDTEADIHDDIATVSVPHRQTGHVQHQLTDVRGWHVDGELDIAADHELGEVRLGRRGGQSLADHLA